MGLCDVTTEYRYDDYVVYSVRVVLMSVGE